MQDLVKKTSLHNAYFLPLHNKNKNVMGRKSSADNAMSINQAKLTCV